MNVRNIPFILAINEHVYDGLVNLLARICEVLFRENISHFTNLIVVIGNQEFITPLFNKITIWS